MQMQNGHHLNALLFSNKIHAVREAPKKRTMHRVTCLRELSGVVCYTTKYMIKLGKESLT